MPDEITRTVLRLDPDAIAHAAGQMLDLGLEVGRLARTLLPELDIDPPALGTLAGAARLARAHSQHVADMLSALANLGDRLEADADRLYRVAFAAEEADQAARARGRRAIGWLGGQW